ncbi:MAG: HAMP domain-containing histidine kinase [Chloroflexota bacterium]|nr:MAG: HAMP domain-containing histidine kinase [Chloroflexota bacterium]
MRTTRLVGLLLAPSIVGASLAVLMESELLPTSIFVFRLQASAGIVAGLVGLATSVLGILAWWLLRHWRAALRQARVDGHRLQEEAHRRFVHRLNHELKNPLTAIRAGLTNLQEAGPQAHASLLNIHRQVERLGTLANDLRKLTDLDLGEAEQELVGLPELVQEAVEMSRSAREQDDRAITINVQRLPWSLSPAQGDRDLLLLAIYNLLDNALKFSDPGATVEVRVGEDGARATVEVTDTGRGIAAQDLPHVTEELYRGQDSQGTEGSGLGLALVQRVAVLHGGELLIRSRQGQGTVATLRLPLGRK